MLHIKYMCMYVCVYIYLYIHILNTESLGGKKSPELVVTLSAFFPPWKSSFLTTMLLFCL